MIRAGFARSAFRRRRNSSASAPQNTPKSAPITASRSMGLEAACRLDTIAPLVACGADPRRCGSEALLPAVPCPETGCAERTRVGTRVGSSSTSVDDVLAVGTSRGSSPTPRNGVAGCAPPTSEVPLPVSMLSTAAGAGSVAAADAPRGTGDGAGAAAGTVAVEVELIGRFAVVAGSVEVSGLALRDDAGAGSAAGTSPADAVGSGVAAGSSDPEATASTGKAGGASGTCSDDCGAVGSPFAAGATAAAPAPSATAGGSTLGRGGSSVKGST
jgi:hypothetical protein